MVFDPLPNVAHNGWPSVGGEGKATIRIVAQDRAPQADATCLQRFVERQAAKELLAYDSLDEAVVTAHEVVEGKMTASLRLLEQGGLGGTNKGHLLCEMPLSCLKLAYPPKCLPRNAWVDFNIRYCFDHPMSCRVASDHHLPYD